MLASIKVIQTQKQSRIHFATKSLILVLLVLITQKNYAQTYFTSIVNVAGNYANKGDINVEWNVGESVLINTAFNGSTVLTQGLLQGYAAIKPTIGDVIAFQASEVKVYPNPASSFFNMDVFTTLQGVMEWSLLDNNGSFLKSGKFNYYGEGKSIKVDMTGLASGTYFLKVSIIRFGIGFTKPMREVGIKIVKINQ